MSGSVHCHRCGALYATDWFSVLPGTWSQRCRCRCPMPSTPGGPALDEGPLFQGPPEVA